MGVESSPELPPSVEAPRKPRKPLRRRLVKSSTAVLIAVLTGVASAATTVFVTRLTAPSPPSSNLPAAQVLRVDSLKSNETNTIGPESFGAPIAGDLIVDLPSGKQIFAAVRGKWDSEDTGDLRKGALSFTQCSADFNAGTFDCGVPWLGKPGDLEDYFIYVGLADQNSAGSIIDALEEQAKSNEDANWSHQAPPGFDTLSSIVVKRQ